MMTTPCFGWTIYDKSLIDELALFIKKDTKGVQNVYHAMPGPNSHDDHVMAFIWCAYMLNNERVDRHFIVIDTTTTQIGQVYAHYLQPLEQYNAADVAKLKSDPLYKQFLECREEAMKLS